MVYIIYKLEYTDSSFHEAEAGFANSLIAACNETYKIIVNQLISNDGLKYKYYIREFTEPVKPMSCPVAIYTFDAHYNCIHNKQIVWSP